MNSFIKTIGNFDFKFIREDEETKNFTIIARHIEDKYLFKYPNTDTKVDIYTVTENDNKPQKFDNDVIYKLFYGYYNDYKGIKLEVTEQLKDDNRSIKLLLTVKNNIHPAFDNKFEFICNKVFVSDTERLSIKLDDYKREIWILKEKNGIRKEEIKSLKEMVKKNNKELRELKERVKNVEEVSIDDITGEVSNKLEQHLKEFEEIKNDLKNRHLL